MSTIVGASTGKIDVQTTVDQLIEVEYTKRLDPIDTKITRKQSAITAVDKLKTAAADLEDKLAALEDKTQFSGDSAAGNLATSLKAVVASYNGLQALVKEYGSVNAADADHDTPKEVVLYGDSGLTSLKRLLSDGLSAGLKTKAGDTIHFSALGVTRKTDGTVTFSQATLNQATANSELMTNIGGGVTSAFRSNLNKAAAYTGLFQSRSNQLNSDLYTLRKRRDTVYDQIGAQKARWLSMYSKLSTTLESLGTTSSYLTAQLKSLQSNNS